MNFYRNWIALGLCIVLTACNYTIGPDKPKPTLDTPGLIQIEYRHSESYALRTTPESISENEKQEVIREGRRLIMLDAKDRCESYPEVVDTLVSYTVLQILGVDSDIIMNVDYFVQCEPNDDPF